MKDPLYGLECTQSKMFPDETIFYRLHESTELSYSLHKDLMDKTNVFPLLKEYNDFFHKNRKCNKFFKYCVSLTIFMNGDDYVTLEKVNAFIKESRVQ